MRDLLQRQSQQSAHLSPMSPGGGPLFCSYLQGANWISCPVLLMHNLKSNSTSCLSCHICKMGPLSPTLEEIGATKKWPDLGGSFLGMLEF